VDNHKKTLILIHGAGPTHYRSLPDGTGDWQLKLAATFAKNYKVITPQMPAPTKPNYEVWKSLLDKYVTKLKGEVVFVGHSLGGSFLVKYLAEESIEHKVAGLFIVSTPFNTVKGFEVPTDLSKIYAIENKMIYQCIDDVEVPYAHSLLFQERLKANLNTFNGRGHYFKRTDFPEIIRDVRNVLISKNDNVHPVGISRIKLF
jgi:predicted alpha/beta hydrolase family esterase